MVRLNVMLIEDHDLLRGELAEVLTEQGHAVRALSCAESLEDEFGGTPIDLLIVDVNLPGEDGLSLTRRMRAAQPTLGIIMITARHHLVDRVAGYQHGADIYLVKPVNVLELLAAVQAMARRYHTSRLITSAQQFLAPLQLTLDADRLCLRGPLADVGLSDSETVILTAFSRAPEHRLETWQIAEALGKSIDDESRSNLEVMLVRLRKKLAQAGAPGVALQSIRLQGYRLCVHLKIQ